MKARIGIGVGLMMGVAAVAAQPSVAVWRAEGMEGGFAAHERWKPGTLDPRLDEAATWIALAPPDATDSAAAHGRFAYQPQNDEGLNPARYIRIVLAPRDCHRMNLGWLTINVYSMAAGPVHAAVRTGVDGFQGSILNAPLVRGSHNTLRVNLARLGLAGLEGPIEFRLYLWGAQGVQVGYLADSRTEPAASLAGSVAPPR